jgi:quinol monooxygenase YgiN
MAPIVRVFRARVKPGQQANMQQLVRELSIPELSQSEGLLAYYPCEPLGDTEEFAMVSVWRDLGAVRSYAGDDWALPVIYPGEEEVLAEVHVHHYQLFD